MGNGAHIRKPQPRRRGNQFYLDRSISAGTTLCGAPVTAYDILLTQAKAKCRRAWVLAEICPVCRSEAGIEE